MKDCYTYLFSFIAAVAAESSARDIGGDRLYFSALCFDGTKKETRQRRKTDPWLVLDAKYCVSTLVGVRRKILRLYPWLVLDAKYCVSTF